MKAHLASYRKGWQSENLARYILSNFAFIAQPSTVSDDLGSDFFCTIFTSITEGNNRYLMPKESFAIQIKSNSKRQKRIPGKAEYLKNLEIPFFIGTFDKKYSELHIYSGEYLIPYFIDNPSIGKLQIRLCLAADCYDNLYRDDNGISIINFPLIARMGMNPKSLEFTAAVNTIAKTCRIISDNITRRNNKEFIFFESLSNKFICVQSMTFMKASFDRQLNKLGTQLAFVLKNGYIEGDLDRYHAINDSLVKFASACAPNVDQRFDQLLVDKGENNLD